MSPHDHTSTSMYSDVMCSKKPVSRSPAPAVSPYQLADQSAELRSHLYQAAYQHHSPFRWDPPPHGDHCDPSAAGSPSSRPAPSTDTSSRCRPRRCGCPTPSPTPATRPPTPWARRAPPPGRRSQEATSGNTPRTGPSLGSLHTARARSRNPRTNLPQSLGTSASSRGRGGGRAAAAGSGAACRPGPARSSRRPTSGWGA